MQKWEYKIVYEYILETNKNIIVGTKISLIWNNPKGSSNGPAWETIQRWGEEGWELVNAFPISEFRTGDNAGYTSHVCFIFKRPIQ